MKFIAQLYNRLSSYVPIVLMGVLALGTYWLAKNPPWQAPTVVSKAPSHEFDYFMREFGIKTFDAAGQLKSEVAGQKLLHFPDVDTLEIEHVRIRSYSPQGRLTTTTANKALSNGDGSEVQLLGQAQIVREAMSDQSGRDAPRLEFHGEFLHAFLNTEQVRSHLPVTMIHGADQFSADRLDYDNVEQIAMLTGRVKGVLAPRNPSVKSR